MTVSQEKMEKALAYLASTDIEYGQAKAACEGYKYRLKIQRAHALVSQIGKEGTVSEKEAKAEINQEYENMVNEYQEACTIRDTVGSKRKTAELIIDVWRSLNASRRIGNV